MGSAASGRWGEEREALTITALKFDELVSNADEVLRQDSVG